MSLLSSFVSEPYSQESSISLAEIISALSFALDLTEGAVAGHALRSCLLGMRIAAEAQLPEDQSASLYYALLLKDVGCSSNAARMCQIVGGDDRAVKAGVKLEDWTHPHKPSLTTLKLLWNNVLPDAGMSRRVGRILKIGITQHRNNQEMISIRCDRGASIVAKLGVGELAAEAVRSLDEHWNGSGYPDRSTGAQIPLLSRICAIAQHLDVFATERSPQVAVDVLRQRSGTWFDPQLVRVAESLHTGHRLWSHALSTDGLEATREAVIGLDPSCALGLSASHIDTICEAFAQVVDAKSPFTFRHSLGVADAALLIATEMGLPRSSIQLIRRAALLHDIGKLRVPNSILDKNGPLTAEERAVVAEHPGLTRSILGRISSFSRLSVVAGQHHELLDGSGYPDGLDHRSLSIESRVLTAADIYGALSEERPYRAGLPLEKVRSIMQEEFRKKVDPGCMKALFAGLDVHRHEIRCAHPGMGDGGALMLPSPLQSAAFTAV